MEEALNEENLSNKPTKVETKSVKKNYIYNVIFQIFSLIVPLITTPYISRILSAEGVGQYSFTSSLQSYFILIAALGFGYYAQRQIAFHQNNKKEQSKVFWEIVVVRLISVGIAVLLNLILCFTGVYHEYSQLMLWWTINIFSVAVDVSFLFQGNEDFKKTVLRDMIIKLISVALIFVLVKRSDDVWLYVILTSGANLLGRLSLWFYLPKYLVKIDSKELKPIRHLLPTIKLFIPTIATSIYTVLDKTLIGVLISDTYVVKETQIIDGVETVVEVVKKYSDLENGYYEQSEKIVKMCMAVITALGTVMIPRNSKLYAEGNQTKLKDNIYFATNYVWIFGLPMAFGLAAIAPNIIPWFLGPGYNKCIPLMQFFTPLIIFIGFSNIFGLQYLIPTGRDKKFTIGIITGSISNLILNCIFIPLFWSYGAVIASLIAEFLVTFTMYMLIRKELSLKKMLLQSIKPLIASVIMFLICYFIGKKLTPSIVNTAIVAILGIVIYFSILILLKEELIYKTFDNINARFSKNNGKIQEKQNNRNVNLDLIKLIACILVVWLHTIKLNNNAVMLIIYNFGVYAIPLFLLVEGYLLLKKERITYNYCFKKILNIIKLVTIFNFVCFVFKLYSTKDIVSSLSEFYEWFIQRGMLSVYWYFGMLIILYLILPILKYIFDHKRIYFIFMILLFASNIIINLWMFLSKVSIANVTIQTFRLWIFIYYFMLGGLIYKYKDKITKTLSLRTNVTLFIISFAFIICGLYLLEVKWFNDTRCEIFYSYILVVISCLLLFTLLLRIKNISKPTLVLKLSSLTLLVYLLHWFVIIAFDKCVSILGLDLAWYMSTLKFIFTLVGSFTIAYIISEIPIVNKIFKM